jgi:integrase
MASVRKKLGTPRRDGTRPVKWVASWYDRDGRQREKYFDLKTDAKAHAAAMEIDPGAAGRATLAEASESFLSAYEGLVEAGERRRSSYDQKRQHLRQHAGGAPIAAMRMAEIRTRDIQAFYDGLIEGGTSYALARKIAQTVRQFWKWAAARDLTGQPGAAAAATIAAPRSRRLAEPVEIPDRSECRAMLDAADDRDDRGRAAALVRLVMFGGLRAGELRALRRSVDLVLNGPVPGVHVRRSADKYGEIHDAPKTDASRRFVPLGPETISALRRWSLAAPKGELDLLFPSDTGGLWDHAGLYRNTWTPVMRAAGLADQTGREAPRRHPRGAYAPAIWTPRYSPKTARHIAASLWIDQGAGPKQIMARMGHATVKLTMELYGHLWPADAADAAMAAKAERAFD